MRQGCTKRLSGSRCGTVELVDNAPAAGKIKDSSGDEENHYEAAELLEGCTKCNLKQDTYSRRERDRTRIKM